MAADDLARFEREPWHKEAVRVRRWDEKAKVAGLKTPTFTDFAALIERVFAAVSAAATHE
jgi:[1-hydroxy-2-(trimethylamino)ethyl]phosphonate dioxygenase